MKSLMSANIEKQTKSLTLETLTLRGELEKYKEILIKFQNMQKLNQQLNADQDLNFLVSGLDDKDYNVLSELDKIDAEKMDLEDMMEHRDSMLHSGIKTE